MRNHTRIVLACLVGALTLFAGCATTDTANGDQAVVIPDEPETARKTAGSVAGDGPIRSQVQPIDGGRLNPLKQWSDSITGAAH